MAYRGLLKPVVTTVGHVIDPTNMFSRLSDYGRKPHSLLFESKYIVPKYGEQSIGVGEPCLRVRGAGGLFEITALNETGERFVGHLSGDFDFAEDVDYGRLSISGSLRPERKAVSEDERLRLKTHADVLRIVAFKFTPAYKPMSTYGELLRTYGGLFGGISYDFIDQYEDLPPPRSNVLKDPDYLMYFADNLFVVDHKHSRTHLVSNALIAGEKESVAVDEARNKLRRLENAMYGEKPKPRMFKPKKGTVATDMPREEYERLVTVMREHIMAGDVFQAVLARKIIADYNAEPLDIYRELRMMNPSPYMFFVNNGSDGILLGASPEMAVRVYDGEVEIRPIAGTRQRGFVNGAIDKDKDKALEMELKTDAKELAEHMMLVDLARNDVAQVSVPGTRTVDELCTVEKYSHVQHLVSNVRGKLKPGLDCLHAYVATMNMGTLTGAPKVMAMRLLREHEPSKRGFYGGSVGYITPSGDMDTAIVIRSMELKGGKAYVSAGAGIVYDSDPASEFNETESKAKAPLTAIQKAGGIL